jgi:choline-sulfatase
MPPRSTRPASAGASAARRSPAFNAFLAALLATVACTDAGSTAAPPRAAANAVAELPRLHAADVIVISFDALRADALGTYGGSRGATPQMDAFAAESVVFENAYTASPITPTSFAAFFSGMQPMKVFQAWHFDPPVSLAERFGAAGYRTAAFLNNVQLTGERGFDRGFDEYEWRMNVPDDQVLAEAVAWLERHAPSEQPVFLWIHLLRPHAPYRAHPEASHLYRDVGYDGEFTRTSGIKFHSKDPQDLARLQDLYAGEVWMADRLFGDFVAFARRTGLLDSAIVVLTADHGEEFLEHQAYQHSRLYEEHLRIPLILRHPGTTGRRVAARARSVDLMPTLLGLVEHPVTDAIDGIDLASNRFDPAAPPPVFAAITTAQVLVSVRDGDEKLIVTCHPTVGIELYDLAEDPAERVDLAAQRESSVRRLVGELHAELDGSPCRQANLARRDWERSEVDAETLEALRALGYVG